MKQSVVQRRPFSQPLYQEALDAASAIQGREVGLRDLVGFITHQQGRIRMLEHARRAETKTLWRFLCRSAAREYHLRGRLAKRALELFATWESLRVVDRRVARWQRVAGGMGAVLLVKGLVLLHLMGVL